MLSLNVTRRMRGFRLLAGMLLAGLVFFTAASTGRAEVKTNSALSLVPADTAIFGTLLRTKEQIDLFYNSNAYKTLRSLPLVKEAWAQAEKELSKGDGPLAMYNELIKDPQNKELVELLLEAGSEEIFFYGGRHWGDFARLAAIINNAQSWAPLTALAGGGGDPNRAQIRGILLGLQKNSQLLKIPETVIGLKIKSKDKAQNQLKRLEKLAEMVVEQVPPLKGRMKRQKLGDSEFFTVELDGSIVPWEDVNLREFEDKKDEFEDLINAAKKLTLCISIGVKDGYLMLGLTNQFKDLAKLDSKGSTLAGREEMKDLEKFASKPLTGISYVSQDYLRTVQYAYADFESIGETLKNLLKNADGLSDERKKAMEKDLNALIAKAKNTKIESGAQLAFSFLTPTGYEGYSYDFGKHDDLKEVDCKLRDHLGGNPILAAAFAFKVDGESYKEFADLIKMFYGHAEAAFQEAPVGEQEKEIFKKITEVLIPFAKELDSITTKKLLPSLKESGLGLVLDAKWTSNAWHNEVKTDKAMPMLELGLLVGLSDAKLFETAMTDYRKAINNFYDKLRNALPNNGDLPPFAIPDPQREKVGSGVLLFYPLPEEIGLDKQVQPLVGVGKNASVLAFSKQHAERLMTATPLKHKSAPLSRKEKLVGVSLLDWPQLVDTALPWVEFSARQANREATDKKSKDETEAILKQVKTVAEVLKCFRGSSSASFLEEGKLVTHSEILVKDLESALSK